MNEQQATAAAPEPAPEPARVYRVGQVWRTREGKICTVIEVDEDDFYLPVCTDLNEATWHSADPEDPNYLVELISDPTDSSNNDN
jgi:crotonobetainyl-CoA:carnitine CoA-transferase CaiB-like acyl-CoA transferase